MGEGEERESGGVGEEREMVRERDGGGERKMVRERRERWCGRGERW